MKSIFEPFRFIDKLEIETKAIEVLLKMQQTSNYVPKWPLDASRVAEFLGLDVVWDSIPDDDGGAIAARILPLERLIEINEDIPTLRGGFGESTIAHEIGHWVLHINPNLVDRYLRLAKRGIEIQVEPLLCRSVNNLDGIEWQAQYFAGCLLMPQYKLLELQQGKDLTKWRHLYAIAEEFGVTISNLVNRLKDLGWIELKDNSRQICLGEAVPKGLGKPKIKMQKI
ncbi:MAG: ImmA/IrrE family metallo-endopeptidase [Xenococcaceae cyanobacterium]